ncbi:MAG: SRPBCC domain-containing protein [Saprospiraceae bacterium]|nr:SRPBCC domain-containing protein [Saprospiraceae bacterium]
MKKIQFKKEINATAFNVYEIMLGLKDKSSYENWTAAFNPTSTYIGSWKKGSKIHFVGLDENGKKGGMVSEIMEHEAAKFISIRHYGILDGETEITTGEQVEKWAGAHENYSYLENNGITTVTVDIDILEDYLDYFNNTYPKALEKLKEISEQKAGQLKM